MWTQIDLNNDIGIRKHIAIMQQMDGGYGALTAGDIRTTMLERQGELWHYRGQGFEIGMLFQYSPEREHWQLAQVGFIGNVQPAQVLDINVQRGRAFVQLHGITSFFAAVPKTMAFAPLLAYYDLCLHHPELNIAIIYQAESKDIWEIRFRSP